ncbi:MAG: hypothetical protein IJM26_05705 [Lachnospiraceae bacterium]|nr:hypothetical protein [Lachnospiraceae bacterium]
MSRRHLTIPRRGARILLILLLMAGVFLIHGAGARAAERSGSVTDGPLNVRTGYGTSYDKLTYNGSTVQLAKGTKVTILGSKDVSGTTWYQIRFSYSGTTLEGYVSGAYIKIETQEGTINAGPLNVRTGYGTSYDKLTYNGSTVQLAKGTKVTILASQDVSGTTWYEITFTYSGATLTGYVSGDYVTLGSGSDDPDDPVDPDVPEISGLKAATGGSAVKAGNVTTYLWQKETDTSVEGESAVVKEGPLNVRTGYGTSYDQLTYNGVKVKLSAGARVTLLESKDVSGTTWYKISFAYGTTTLTGYVSGAYLKLESDSDTGDDESFEKELTAQGFPESYKEGLRLLHSIHPTWTFLAYQTGVTWSAAVKAENVPGKNLIPKTRDISYLSFAEGCYDYATDKHVVFDGTTWVTASELALKYYMDPRNWLTESYIYQFETLSYEKSKQTEAGVEKILAGTPFAKKSFSYTSGGSTKSTTYAKAIIDAAAYSGVSPYHLASRIKQEVVTGSNSVSGSVSGNYSGYQGYYNFYNIGASASTDGGAIRSALEFAKNGTSNATNNAYYKIPWDNQYDAIVGGAAYIGSTYINKGQNTVYLQKFNVTGYSRYGHQYMQNVEAPYSEAYKMYSAYSAMDEMPLVFSIPVYVSLPSSTCAKPSGVKNPNNWLKSIASSVGTMSPKFSTANGPDTTYTVTVSSSVSSVQLTATPVVSGATVSGTGTIKLSSTTTTVTIKCKALNGDVSEYTVKIVKK